jgi:hypothetical protein
MCNNNEDSRPHKGDIAKKNSAKKLAKKKKKKNSRNSPILFSEPRQKQADQIQPFQ